MRLKMLRAFWNCGDNQIIEYSMLRARLNRIERKVIQLIMDECQTQEQVAEELDLSTRKVQDIWYSAADKLLNQAWVKAYANELLKEKDNATEIS